MAAPAASSGGIHPLWTLVDRRLRSFTYIKEVYVGNRLFLSVASVASLGSAKDDGFDESQVLRWFYLGVSLATLLPQPPGAPFVRALLQLFEEHKFHFASSTERNIKAIRSRPPVKLSSGGESDELAPALQRANGKVLYEYLLTPHVAHALSGVQVLTSLCDLMPRLYRKLAECPSAVGATPALTEAVMRVDAIVEEAFLTPAVKHAEGLARTALRQNLGRLDPLFGRLWGQASPQDVDTMERPIVGSGQTSAAL